MTTDGGSAGTAAARFRATPADHTWQAVPHPEELGLRETCAGCGRGKTEHPRRTT